MSPLSLRKRNGPLFSTRTLIRRSLVHEWRLNLAVAAAVAVGVAVLSGSLLLGTSLRASLRALSLERLGRIDQALVADHFFREPLAEAIGASAPAILLRGAAAQAEGTGRAGRVQVLGIHDSFWSLGDANQAVPPDPGEDGALINEPLARELHARVGDEILLRLPRPSAIPHETLLGERDDTILTLRLRVSAVVPARGLGRFALTPAQQDPLNVYLPLASLQQRLGRPEKINAIFASESAGDPQQALENNFTIEDLGLRLRRNGQPPYLALESEQIFIPDSLAAPALKRAAVLGLKPTRTLAYLANSLSLRGRSIPYSMVAAREEDDAALKDGEVALNTWAAEDLGARPGDRLALTYFVPGPRGQLVETSTTLSVARIVPLAGEFADPGLTPEVPGLSDADTLAHWDSPFPIDLSRIRPKDEAYWDRYRATPKAFVSLRTGQRLWANRYGRLTAIRMAEGPAQATALESALRRVIDPARVGLTFEPVKARSLAASRGSSDFGGLFLGFSLFLLVAAALLIRMLFVLGAEGRARQYGLLLAVGFTPRRLLRLLLAEGALVALAGAALGMALGVGYARLLIHGLHTWWVGAVGTPFLALYVNPADLLGGAAGGWLVGMLAIWRAARRLARQPVRALLAGKVQGAGPGAAGRPTKSLLAGSLCFLLALGLGLAAPRLSAGEQAAAFFAIGALLLTGTLVLLRAWLRSGPALNRQRLTLTRLGFSAARRQPGRSLLVTALVACAAFVIVAVGANRHVARPSQDRRSGGGGFTLLAESAMPLYRPLESKLLKGATAYALRLRAGDDASCLNLYQAARPRLLGLPEAFIRRGGFAFAGSTATDPAAQENPWLLLGRPQPDGAVPLIGDYNSVVWLLHKGLGQEVELDGVRCRFVALLKGSVFQSELLISEENFTRLYPREGGWRVFLVDAPPAQAPALGAALENAYEDHGLDATDPAERLSDLLRVERTYLSTFQSLGGLGLLLGTLGLALALLRNLIERRAEFALLRALGYRFSDLVWLAVAENFLLLLIGLATGSICALLTVVPALLSRAAEPPWLALSATLGAILACGLLAATLATVAVLRSPIMASLKRE